MRSSFLYFFTAVFFTSGVLFFLKGFFLPRAEIFDKSTDNLDIHASFHNLKQTVESSQRFLSKSVFDLGQTLQNQYQQSPSSAYYTLFNAMHKSPTSTQSFSTSISPITLLSTINSMPNSIEQLFSPSVTPTATPEQPGQDAQTCSWFCRQYDQIIYILVDALRFDFITYDRSLSPDGNPPPISSKYPPYINRLSSLANYHHQNPTKSGIYRFRADSPTVTMQRIKALLTGSLSIFLDVKDNFAATMIDEDNFMHQVHAKGMYSVMVGDDTWYGLIGPLLTRPYPYPSFDVQDLDTVDDGCTYRTHHELCGRTLTSMKIGLDEYFQQFLFNNQLNVNGAKSKAELDDLRREAQTVQKYISEHLIYENDALLSHATSSKTHHDENLLTDVEDNQNDEDKLPYSIPDEINYTNMTTKPTWYIAHFLGVDHVGHRFGPRHPLMDAKLRQLNGVLQQFLDYINTVADHTSTKTKPYFSVFQDQYDFVMKNCDKSTTDPFSQQFSMIENIIQKQQPQFFTPGNKLQANYQLDVSKFSAKFPLARSVVYVMGDHGMTEGGNHGGASSKETHAGFAFFSSLTLDSPSSYVKEQNKALKSTFGSSYSMFRTRYNAVSEIYSQLSSTLSLAPNNTLNNVNLPIITSQHENLPPLNVLYDYAPLNNPGRFDSTLQSQTPDEYSFSLGQIDSVPTISLIAGIPIPYGSLGVLKKEIVPNQFLDQHLHHLTGSYDDDWATIEQICSLFSTFSNTNSLVDEQVHIKIAELRHELMIFHLRILNLGQVLRYSKDYADTVKGFSGRFVQDAFTHAHVLWAKIGVIEDTISTLSTICQNPSIPGTNITNLSQMMDTLFPAVLDASQHTHLLLTHIKSGFAQNWTQFDMLFMGCGVLMFVILTTIALAQFIHYILRARQNKALQIQTDDQLSSNRNDNVVPCKPITNSWKLLKWLFILCIITATVLSLTAAILWINPQNHSEIRIPQHLVGAFDPSLTLSKKLHQPKNLGTDGVTDKPVVKIETHSSKLFTFIGIIFLFTFATFFTIYQIIQLISALLFTFFHNRDYQRTKIAPERFTWLKFFVTIGTVIALSQGFMSTTFMDTSYTHICCVFVAAWSFFAINGSFRYYYEQVHPLFLSFSSSRISSDDEIDLDDFDAPSQQQHNFSPINRNEIEDEGEAESEYENQPLVSSTLSFSTQNKNHISDGNNNNDSNKSINLGFSSTTTTISPSLFLKKHTLSPSKFLFLSIIAFFCVALMSFENELTDLHAKRVFNIPIQEHKTSTAWYQNLTKDGFFSSIQTLFENVDDFVISMSHVQLKTGLQLQAERQAEKLKKIEEALQRQSEANNNNNNSNTANNGGDLSKNSTVLHKMVSEPEVETTVDPAQVVKTSLTMFSPDISLDGSYVRQEKHVFLIIRDAVTKEVILNLGELYKEEDYYSNKAQIHTELIARYENHGKYKNILVEPIVSEFNGSANDPRSHFTSLHVVIILTLFITSLYIISQHMLVTVPLPSSLRHSKNIHTINNFFKNLPHYITLYTKYLIPVTAINIACYWIPNVLALFVQPFLQLFIFFFGTCHDLSQHNPLLTLSDSTSNSIFSPENQLQLCAATSDHMRPIIVQVLRMYIPSFVYITFLLGIIFLLIPFIIQFINLHSNHTSHIHQKFYTPQQLFTFIFIIIFPSVCLVSGPRSTVVYALYVIFMQISKQLIQSIFIIIPYNKQLVHLANFVSLFAFMTTVMFHATGHAYSFNDLHIASGFVGIPWYIFGISETLVFFNTFGGIIFGTLGCAMFGYYSTTIYQQYLETVQNSDQGIPQNHSRLQISNQTNTHHFLSFSRIIPVAWSVFWISLSIGLCTYNIYKKRRDPYVWSMYAPHWLVITVMSIIPTVVLVIYTFTLPSEEKHSNL